MGWLLLIAGLALWAGAHLFKRVRPEQRAAMGEKGKGLMAALIAAALVLMIVGYRWAPSTPLWYPPYFLVHLNNLLMLAAFYVYGIGAVKGRLAQKMRHPQLIGFKIWATAHLLVNGEVKAVLLFGGLLAWAVVEVIRINRAEPEWTPPAEIRPRGDVVNLAVALVLYGVVAGIHAWLGVWPFG